MSRPKPEDYILYTGEKFQVEFYFTEKGELPAKEYFDSSEYQVKIKLLALVKYMAEYAKLFDESKFRLVDPKEKIYEFKPKDERFFNFFCADHRIIITNAYRKKGRKVNPGELRKAIRFKKDYESRIKESGYYENQ
ncbi:MAG: type II toxin-antitoxin system RelE/ParE family toxin [Candidatus Omnitrophota bacterium]